MIATMALLLIAGLLAGVALGLLRFKVFVLLPSLGGICILAIGVAIAAPSEILMIALATAFVAISLQIGYLSGSAIRHILDARHGRSHPSVAGAHKESAPPETLDGDSPRTARHSSLLPP
jgi:hypothetical protein